MNSEVPGLVYANYTIDTQSVVVTPKAISSRYSMKIVNPNVYGTVKDIMSLDEAIRYNEEKLIGNSHSEVLVFLYLIKIIELKGDKILRDHCS